jgi:hypothetical protein
MAAAFKERDSIIQQAKEKVRLWKAEGRAKILVLSLRAVFPANLQPKSNEIWIWISLKRNRPLPSAEAFSAISKPSVKGQVYELRSGFHNCYALSALPSLLARDVQVAYDAF